MATETITPEEFAERYPRARGDARATGYVVVTGPARYPARCPNYAIPAGHSAWEVGYTNAGARRVTRYALIPDTGEA